MIVLGKTIAVEFAKGIVGINHIQGTPHNPWCEEHCVPGGSGERGGRGCEGGDAGSYPDSVRTPADLSVYRLACLEPSASNRLLDGSVVSVSSR